MKFEDATMMAMARLVGSGDFLKVKDELERQEKELTKELLSVDASQVGRVGRIQGKIEIISELIEKISGARSIAGKISKNREKR